MRCVYSRNIFQEDGTVLLESIDAHTALLPSWTGLFTIQIPLWAVPTKIIFGCLYLGLWAMGCWKVPGAECGKHTHQPVGHPTIPHGSKYPEGIYPKASFRFRFQIQNPDRAKVPHSKASTQHHGYEYTTQGQSQLGSQHLDIRR